MKPPVLLAAAALLAACGSSRKWSRTPDQLAADPQPPSDLLAALADADEEARLAAADELRKAGFVARGAAAEGFVDVAELDPTILVDMVFFTGRNLLDRNFYGVNVCLVREELGRAIADASARVRAQGYLLVVRDCYRPLSVQRTLVEAPSYEGLVASLEYANHPRGAAVDARLATPDGREAALSPKGWPLRRAMAADADVPEPYRARRAVLRQAMVAAGLAPIRKEYWHFDLRQPRRYPQLDVPVAAMARWLRAPAVPPPAPVAFVPADPADLGAAW